MFVPGSFEIELFQGERPAINMHVHLHEKYSTIPYNTAPFDVLRMHVVKVRVLSL